MLRARKSKPVASSGEQGFNSSDVSRICGVSLRQLQWWDERNVVSPRQDGHKRVYQSAEVVEISVIAELRRKGFSLQKIRRVLRFLQKDMGQTPRRRPGFVCRGTFAYRREEHLLGRRAQPDHRSDEECPPTDVSGVRHRSGEAFDRDDRAQARQVGDFRCRAEKGRQLLIFLL